MTENVLIEVSTEAGTLINVSPVITYVTVAVETEYVPVKVKVESGRQGPKGDTGSGTAAEVIKNETPAGLVNGSNATFTTAFNFLPESVEVFIGLKLKVIDDYITIGSNQIQFTQSPLPGEKILVNYIKA